MELTKRARSIADRVLLEQDLVGPLTLTDVAPFATRIDRELARLDAEDLGIDDRELEDEIGKWITYTLGVVEASKAAGRPTSPGFALNKLVSKCEHRASDRRRDAPTIRERARAAKASPPKDDEPLVKSGENGLDTSYRITAKGRETFAAEFNVPLEQIPEKIRASGDFGTSIVERVRRALRARFEKVRPIRPTGTDGSSA